ncbi:MAG: histidine phosphatase family protein [Anaerolineaceae bacterium]|nr:histidine phosphatase family protein [Anaerolineaceae bacterium]
MTGLIYLMRHGQSVVNVERRLTCRKFEGDLTELGREQAARAAVWLADKGITRIGHSPFHRAVQTAQIVARKLNQTLEMEDGLREMDCGGFEGRTDDAAWEEFIAIYRRWKSAEWDAAFPDGETFRHAYERFSRCLHAAGDNTLLVTHGGITLTVVPYLCVNAAALQRTDYLDNTGLVVLERYDAERYICRSWNLVEHL